MADCVLSYCVRTFAITGFYHRYFSHRTYSMGRVMQFIAFVGSTAVQKGVLWWAAHHRVHHKASDTPGDPHNSHEGFLHPHWLWFVYRESDRIDYDGIRDLTRYPELRLLQTLWVVPPALLAAGLCLVGGWHLTVWGFFVSTFFVSNGTYSVNSLMHYYGKQNFLTGDESRYHWLFAPITLGEGWHNNHHRYPASARNGFYWYEFDVTYWILRLMSWASLVRDLKPVPARVLEEGRVNRQLRNEARRSGVRFRPIKVRRDEIQILGNPMGARALLLRDEIQGLGGQVATRARALRDAIQGLGAQISDHGTAVRAEIQVLGDRLGDRDRVLRAELYGLGQQEAERGQALGRDIKALTEQVGERGRALRVDIEGLGEQMAARGKSLGNEIQELHGFLAVTARELRTQLETLSGHLEDRGRSLRSELEDLLGLLPRTA